ncbi:hypothetical protein BH24PSE2_BH24PSE2_08110 [soil metagenome]
MSCVGGWGELMLWGLLATLGMSTIMHGSQGLGFSRLSLSFLAGTFVTGNRDLANVLGFFIYVVGGWIFAILYALVFCSVRHTSWWLGGILGLIHGILLLVVLLPLLPHAHPRMLTVFHGPTATRRLEPPGFLGLNYGYRTPLITIVSQLVYGIVLGSGLDAS